MSETFSGNIFSFFKAEMSTFQNAYPYSASEVDLEYISILALEELGQRPFRWQLETTMAILTGYRIPFKTWI